MESITKSLRVLADPTRLRILLLLNQEELSVAELQEILSMGQSRISTQLAQLRSAGLVIDRRSGKRALYQLDHSSRNGQDLTPKILDLAQSAAADLPEWERDRTALKLALQKRADKTRAHFDDLAGKFGRAYCPGRSWKGIAEMLLKLMPPLVIADLGAGEGTLSQLLAQRAKKVIAVDNSEKMVAYGRERATTLDLDNLDYRLGDLENPPIDDQSVDLVIFSQALHHASHPERAITKAFHILKPGGRIAILDLKTHHFEEARDLYADEWLGFSEVEFHQFLSNSGFSDSSITVVHREEEKPHFETILAIASRP